MTKQAVVLISDLGISAGYGPTIAAAHRMAYEAGNLHRGKWFVRGVWVGEEGTPGAQVWYDENDRICTLAEWSAS